MAASLSRPQAPRAGISAAWLLLCLLAGVALLLTARVSVLPPPAGPAHLPLTSSSRAGIEPDAALPTVLVLSPVKNAAHHLGRFFANLRALDYPAPNIAVALLESDSDDEPEGGQAHATHVLEASPSEYVRDFMAARRRAAVRKAAVAAAAGLPPPRPPRVSGTLARLLAEVPSLEAAGYRRVQVVEHAFGLSLSREARHEQTNQRRRRSVMARSRNHLLSSALRDDDEWVLWVDSDLDSYPPHVLRRLLASGKPLVVPNCVMARGGRSYDLNSWRLPGLGSNASVTAVRQAHDAIHAELLKAGRPADEVQLEGYTRTGHVYLHQLRGEAVGAVGARGEAGSSGTGADVAVRLDAVGGAMLLVDAELHRHGLMFPAYPHRHRMETEGLSMMALDMGEGTLSWGMPGLEIIHR